MDFDNLLIPYSLAVITKLMNKQEALEILGDRAEWELKNMKKALSTFPILNSDEENERLEAVKVLLKNKA